MQPRGSSPPCTPAASQVARDALAKGRGHKLQQISPLQSLCKTLERDSRKLLCRAGDELQEVVMSHWGERTDGFHCGRFAFANVISRWDRGDDDLGLQYAGA